MRLKFEYVDAFSWAQIKNTVTDLYYKCAGLNVLYKYAFVFCADLR